MVINPKVEGLIQSKYPFVMEAMGDLLKEYKDAEADQVIRYLSWAFDPNSPMVTAHPDLNKRKEQAAKEVGLGKQVKIPASLMVMFLQKVIRNREYTFILSLEQTYDEFTDKINQEITSTGDEEMLKAIERKGKLWREMKAMIQEINDQKRAFYYSDEELMEEEKQRYTPEAMARAMSK